MRLAGLLLLAGAGAFALLAYQAGWWGLLLAPAVLVHLIVGGELVASDDEVRRLRNADWKKPR